MKIPTCCVLCNHEGSAEDVTDPLVKHGRAWDFDCHIRSGNKLIIKATILADTGASEWGFIDKQFVKLNKLTTISLLVPCNLKLADGRLVQQVTQAAQVTIRIGSHFETGWAIVTQLKGYDFIHGMPWFEEHDPTANWANRSLTLKSDYCLANCLQPACPITVNSRSRSTPRMSPPSSTTSWQEQDIVQVSAAALLKLAKKPGYEVFVVYPETSLSAITAEDKKLFLEKVRHRPRPTIEELKRVVPQQYHEFLDRWDY